MMKLSWSPLLLAAACACPPAPEASELAIPADAWRVDLVAGTRHMYLLRVAIKPEFPWPAARKHLRYRASLLRPDESVVTAAGWLDARRRTALIPLISREDAAMMSDPTLLEPAGQAVLAEEREMFAAVAALSGERPAPQLMERLHAFIARRGEPVEGGPDPALYNNRVLLTPEWCGDLHQQAGPPKAPVRPTYTWGSAINDPKDPCHGKTPEQCVWEKLEKIRDRLCNTPGFGFECILLALKMSSEPPSVVVHCSLTGAAASASPISHDLKINGEHFLTSDCLDATILHELKHLFDFAKGGMDNARANARALKRLREAQARLVRAMLANPVDQAELARAQAEVAAAAAEYQRTRVEAVKERLRLECDALFYVLGHAGFLGDRANVLPWLVADIRAMLHQQVMTPFSFGVGTDPAVKARVCECFRRVKRWLDKNPDAKKIFDESEYSASTHTKTWGEYLDTYLRFFCK